ncbi:hypothetical protein O3P69_019790 [Scylla paramamosain]|uniref:RING-type domain-containing protein n=1 Tax=Scylla paramamosain TaxID=85552 RepID=A0AAW0SYI9_SCYPA
MESATKEDPLVERNGKEEKCRGDNPEDCQVCMTAFDDTLQRPRTLPCGHTFCTPCVNRLTARGQVMCATCRLGHPVPEAGQFPINFTLEAFITRGSDSDAGSTSSSPRMARRAKAGAKGGGSLGRKIRSMLQEQEAKVVAALDACQKVQSQLAQYQRTLAGWGSHQQQLEDRLQSVINDSKSARVLVRQEEVQVAVKKEEVQQEEQRLHGVLNVLRRVATEEEAGVAVVDVVHCTHDAEEILEECRVMLPDVHTVTAARRVREASMAAVEAVKTVHASLPAPDAPSDALSPPIAACITDKIQTLLTPTLKAADLHKMTPAARSLIQAGMVVVVTQMEHKRHARMSLEDGRLYLHALQDQPPPPCVARLQMSEVVPAAPPCLVFLDLAWPDARAQQSSHPP